ncbi:MAG: MqnA/MqnD/SBP family protein [Bacteroidia bacterium]
MLIRLFDFLNAYPYQRALQEAGLPYELYADPRQVWEAWKRFPGDAALLPFAAVAHLQRRRPRWGIASRGAVRSVLLVSTHPPTAWESIRVDERSLSSKRILLHLMEKGVLPRLPLLPASSQTAKRVADLVIGDEALRLHRYYPYEIDLGALSQKALHKSSVFAVWWTRREVRGLLSRIWMSKIFLSSEWIIAAATRYNFRPSVVKDYWRGLRFRLPAIGHAYWQRQFRKNFLYSGNEEGENK